MKGWCHTINILQEYRWGLCLIVQVMCYTHDQAALRTPLSVHPSLTPFSLCSHHLIIMKFSGVINIDISDVHTKGQRHSSKVKVTEVKTQFSRFRTVTPVWIHIWPWNDAQTWSSIEEVPYCFSRTSVKFQGHTGIKIADFDPNWAFPDYNSSLNLTMASKWCTKLEIE